MSPAPPAGPEGFRGPGSLRCAVWTRSGYGFPVLSRSPWFEAIGPIPLSERLAASSGRAPLARTPSAASAPKAAMAVNGTAHLRLRRHSGAPLKPLCVVLKSFEGLYSFWRTSAYTGYAFLAILSPHATRTPSNAPNAAGVSQLVLSSSTSCTPYTVRRPACPSAPLVVRS